MELRYSDHKIYPCNDFVWKNNQWESCRRTLELRPIAWKILKRDVVNSEPSIGGINRWLNPKITISPLPLGLVALRTLLVQFLLLHCVIAASILLQSFVFLYSTVRESIVCCWRAYDCPKPWVFSSAPLSTLYCVSVTSRLDTVKLPSWKVSFTPASSSFSVTKEGFMHLLFVVISLFMVAALPLIRQ